MQTHANTLFVQTQGAYLRKDHETVQVKVDGEVKLTVPMHHLEGIVCFGRVSLSPGMMEACGERNLPIAVMTEHGRLQARVVPAMSGNVLLRREQYRRADDAAACLRIARSIVAAKIQNSRMLLLRAARESVRNALRGVPQPASQPPQPTESQIEQVEQPRNATEGVPYKRGETDVAENAESLRRAADRLACSIDTLAKAETLDGVRGCEGDAARCYFDVFSLMVRQNGDTFRLESRSRRPPLDPLNALLSFVYSVLTHDMASALEGVGLDPAVGFLHVDRPGRLSLALDLVEEFRAIIADRLVLSLVNLRQVTPDGFETQPGGAVLMDAKTRKTLLAALTQRKREELQHPVLGERVTIGLLPHVQARLLARHIRGDIEEYPALVLK